MATVNAAGAMEDVGVGVGVAPLSRLIIVATEVTTATVSSEVEDPETTVDMLERLISGRKGPTGPETTAGVKEANDAVPAVTVTVEVAVVVMVASASVTVTVVAAVPPTWLPMPVLMLEALDDDDDEEEVMRPGKAVITLEVEVVDVSAADMDDDERSGAGTVKKLNRLFMYGAAAEDCEGCERPAKSFEADAASIDVIVGTDTAPIVEAEVGASVTVT